ncbi:MAG TPA: hypothetical protein VJU81_08925 [Methylomirabilota bacterium]|nr:hypothetical protein [Methylomirabilota bacterium]
MRYASGMPTYMAVRRTRGPGWNAAASLRAQAQWTEHAAFMNGLVAEGFIVLGGPLGSGELREGEEVLLVVDSTSEADVHARFATDPWTASGLLVITRIEPWTVLLDGRRR